LNFWLNSQLKKASYHILFNHDTAKLLPVHFAEKSIKSIIIQKAQNSLTANHVKNSFSIFTGTIFENTKLDLRKWVYAISKEAIAGKKGVSGCQC